MDVKFRWKETHHSAFMKLKETIIQAPILQYLDTTKPYIVYTDASDDTCRAQLSQMHNEAERNRIPGSFLIAYVYRHPKEMEYTRTRSIRYLLHHQEMELLPTRSRHHKNTKINRWGLELTSYNITFEWISGARNKAADCLS